MRKQGRSRFDNNRQVCPHHLESPWGCDATLRITVSDPLLRLLDWVLVCRVGAGQVPAFLMNGAAPGEGEEKKSLEKMIRTIIAEETVSRSYRVVQVT